MRQALSLFAVFAIGCGPDVHAPPDQGMGHDLGAVDQSASDLVNADASVTADLGCACATPPATTCLKNAVVSYSVPGACVPDVDAGERCSYPAMSRTCTNGCFNAACTGALNFLGNTQAFITGTSTMVNLTNGMVPAGSRVSILTQTYPAGAASDVHLVYTKSTDPGFTMKTDAVMSYDKFTMNNDQWLATIPAQTAGTTIVWYLYANGYGLTMPIYYSNFGNNFRYTSN